MEKNVLCVTDGAISMKHFWLENGKREESKEIAWRTTTLSPEVTGIKKNIFCYIAHILF